MLPDPEDIGKDYATSAYWFWQASTNLRRDGGSITTVSSLNFLLKNVTAYPKLFTRVHALKESHVNERSA